MFERNKSIIAALDIGGTSLKWTLIGLSYPYSHLTKKFFNKMEINSQGTADEILKVYLGAIETAFHAADSLKLKIQGIGISTPGPFDFDNGISLMKHKFSAIYGVNIKRKIITRLNLEDNFPVRFITDSFAFLTGEAFYGAAKSYSRIIGITLGTGIGSAFMADKKIVVEGKGVPPDGALYIVPYEGGIVEDKISTNAIISRYRQLGGKYTEDTDVVKIDRLAASGDRIALVVFREFGVTLGRVLKNIALDFKPECIVLGGGISRGFYLFGESLKSELKGVPGLEKITTGKLGDLSALYGVIRFFQPGV